MVSVKRSYWTAEIERALGQRSVLWLAGVRRAGKTTLVGELEGASYLLEHLVLGEIAARFGTARLHHWRDKQKHEVDFVLEVGRRRQVLAIECKSSAAKLDPAGLQAFRRAHPRGRNLVVTLRSTEAYRKRIGDIEVEFVPYLQLAAELDALR
jgi:predicted AAA+ superfamily ATPase